MSKALETLIEEDIKTTYLGNLNTVEFDLQLPQRGKNGSEITWFSDNDLFLKSDGSVSRPMHGIGNRKVNLYGTFRYKGMEKVKKYEVNILEEKSQVVIEKVLPIVRKIEKGVMTELPQAVVLQGDNSHLFSRNVVWEGGNEQIFHECGEYLISGKVKNEKLSAILTLFVEEHVEEEKKDAVPVVYSMDNGETNLLDGSVFYKAQERGIAYLKSVDDDQILYNFRSAAGLDTKEADEMSGWDSPKCLLRGHTAGHYLSALALCYREKKDEEILRKINYLIKELAYIQGIFSSKKGFHKGYLGAYSEEQFDLLEQGVLYPDIWAPYYTLHKLLAGLLDVFYCTENKEALEIAEKSAMWIYRRLSKLTKRKREKMWDTYIAGEFGGMNETLVRLYEITKKEEYLITAKMFDNDRLLVPMEEKKDVLEGMHANQHIPQIVGCIEMFKATGLKRYYDIAEYFWAIVTGRHSYVNGGVGEAEMFFEPGISEKYITAETAEYCASYNMLKLTKELFRYSPKAFYMDYYERTMFNHIVAGIFHDESGDISYFYPLNPGAQKDIIVENACCHGTGMESQMKYAEAIYFYKDSEIYINLFLNSQTYWSEKGIYITQKVMEASPEKVVIEIEGETECTLKVRCPYWCNGIYEVLSNTGKMIAKCDSNGYISIDRKRTDNRIEIQFQCKLRTESMNARENIKSLAYGPYILAILSEKEEYLKYNNLANTIKKEKSDGLRFRTREGLVCVPLSEVDREHYHVYWKET